MAQDAKIGELYEEFIKDFLLPLFAGGEAHAVRALPPGLVETFAYSTPSDTDVEFDLQTHMLRAASEIAPIDALPANDFGAMGMAMALHNLGAITDPMLDRTFSRGSIKTMRAWIDAIIEAIPPPRTRGEALSRHVIAERALQFQREDTVVKNWAYTYRFYGRPPPANVVAMPRLRFVKEQKSRREIVDILEEGIDEESLLGVLTELIARSPVTQLLNLQLYPKLVFGLATLAVLSDPGLRSGIVQALIKAGTSGVAQPLGHALRELSAVGAPAEYLHVALVFIAELQVLEVLDERVGHTPLAEPAVGDEELFAAVLPAVIQHDTPLANVAELAESDLERVRRRAEVRRQQAGDDAVDFARSILDRARPLPVSSGAPIGT